MDRNHKNILFCLIALFLTRTSWCNENSNRVWLDNSLDKVNINRLILQLDNSTLRHNAGEMVSGKFDVQFNSPDGHTGGFGFLSKEYWYRFEVNTDQVLNRDWLLIADQQGLDTLELFFKDSSRTWQSLRTNREMNFKDRKYKFNTSVLDLPMYGTGQHLYYLRVISQIYRFPINLVTTDEFSNMNIYRNLFLGLFAGFFVMMILYNLFIYFFERDRNFLLYVIYVLSNGLMICGYKSYLDFFWQDVQHQLSFYLPALVSAASVSLIFFSRAILDLKRNMKIIELLLIYLFLPLILLSFLLLYFADPHSVAMINFILLLVISMLLTVTSFLIYRKKFRPAWFYFLGSVAFLTGCIFYTATLYGIIPHNIVSRNMLELGTAAHIMLFSYALGDKIREYKLLKFQMESELLESLQQNEQIILEQNRLLEIKAAERAGELQLQKDKSDKLLLNILPEEVAVEMKEHGNYEPRLHSNITVLYSDFVNFTRISEHLSPKELVAHLDILFKAFDEIIERHGLEKIRTIGDAYLAVCGLQNEPDHAQRTVQAAIEIRNYLHAVKLTKESFDVRIGIHSGPVVAGVVGTKKFTYDIWGETVNLASKLEQLSEPGKINISENTASLLKKSFHCLKQGSFNARGNESLDYYFVEFT